MAGANRAAALKNLETAEACFKDGKLSEAKRWAFWAHSLYPSVPEVEQALAAYKVHLAAAEKKFAGAPDPHAVLDLPPPPPMLKGKAAPKPDHDAIKKQYQILCYLLDPAKNSCPAAAAACKLVKEAYAALSAKKDGAPEPRRSGVWGVAPLLLLQPKVRPSASSARAAPWVNHMVAAPRGGAVYVQRFVEDEEPIEESPAVANSKAVKLAEVSDGGGSGERRGRGRGRRGRK